MFLSFFLPLSPPSTVYLYCILLFSYFSVCFSLFHLCPFSCCPCPSLSLPVCHPLFSPFLSPFHLSALCPGYIVYLGSRWDSLGLSNVCMWRIMFILVALGCLGGVGGCRGGGSNDHLQHSSVFNSNIFACPWEVDSLIWIPLSLKMLHYAFPQEILLIFRGVRKGRGGISLPPSP